VPAKYALAVMAGQTRGQSFAQVGTQSDVHVRLALLRAGPGAAFIETEILAAQIERGADARAGIEQEGEQRSKFRLEVVGRRDDAERIVGIEPFGDPRRSAQHGSGRRGHCATVTQSLVLA